MSFCRTSTLAEERRLLPEVDAEPWQPGALRSVLLTGTTGGFGLAVLRELLRVPELTAYCLIRADSPRAALDRLRGNMAEYGWSWPEDWERRVVALPGNLTAPGLGLAEHVYRELSRGLEAIVHCAANTSFVRPYAVSRRTNVEGTAALLRLAATGRATAFHHVSSCSVRVPPAYAGRDDIGMYNGYSQSKHISEQLVRLMRGRGLPARVYGIGYLAFGSEPFDARDAFESLLALFIRMGSFPLFSCAFDYTPARAAARRLAQEVARSARGEGRPVKVELHHPQPLRWRELATWAQDRHPGLALVPIEEHLPAYERWMESFAGLKVYGMKSVFSAEFPRQMDLLFDGVSSAFAEDELPAWDQARFLRVLDVLEGGYRWL